MVFISFADMLVVSVSAALLLMASSILAVASRNLDSESIKNWLELTISSPAEMPFKI